MSLLLTIRQFDKRIDVVIARQFNSRFHYNDLSVAGVDERGRWLALVQHTATQTIGLLQDGQRLNQLMSLSKTSIPHISHPNKLVRHRHGGFCATCLNVLEEVELMHGRH